MDKYCRFEINESVHYGRVQEDDIFTLDSEPWNNGKETGLIVPLKEVRLLNPSEPKIIIGLGKCYNESWVGKTIPKNVRWFIKPSTAAAALDDDVVLPPSLDEVKVEPELVIVIGKKVKNADEAEAEQAIFGYTIGNDIVGTVDSYHRLQDDPMDMPESILATGLKICDGFQPFGPFIHRGINWKDRKITLEISSNDSKDIVHYEQNTKTFLYTPAKIVSDLSKLFTLSPGDIISTGTIQSFTVKAGAEVKVTIEGMGTLTNRIVSGRE